LKYEVFEALKMYIVKNSVPIDILKQLLTQFQESINRSLKTERTRLSKAVCEFLEAAVRLMKGEYQKVAELFVESLIQQCGCSNKVAYVAADACMVATIQYAGVPRLAPKFMEVIKTKKDCDQVREFAIEYLLQILQTSDAKMLDRYIDELESILKSAVYDRSPGVRATCKSCFYWYGKIWPDRVSRLVDTSHSFAYVMK
jgi:hypothetical protein